MIGVNANWVRVGRGMWYTSKILCSQLGVKKIEPTGASGFKPIIHIVSCFKMKVVILQKFTPPGIVSYLWPKEIRDDGHYWGRDQKAIEDPEKWVGVEEGCNCFKHGSLGYQSLRTGGSLCLCTRQQLAPVN